MHNTILNSAKRYSEHRIPLGLSYATVADFSDSCDHLPDLSSKAGDLKDVQRPWAFKTICSLLPPGSHLCEVGAGDPYVAAALAQAGYQLTVVDPYEGQGNGPTDFEAFKSLYPNIRFVRDEFRPDLPGLNDFCFDAIYSISVIEHVPFDKIATLLAACEQYLRKGGFHVHAIDVVTAGYGAEYHTEMLNAFLSQFTFSTEEIAALLNKSSFDPETYLLSAESHNRWRGGLAYSEFPMRKVISIQLATETK